jgi:RNA polymerase sigma factor (TIGR02999 family)
MDEPASHEVSQLLQKAAEGNAKVLDALLPLVYQQLRQLAQLRMSQERPEHTLQATALVNEAYLRLVGNQNLAWANRAHFFHAAAEAMRRILIEHARARGRKKREGGQGRKKVPLGVIDLAAAGDSEEIVALDEAFQRLEKEEPGIAAVVRMRFYAGLSVEETAHALGTSIRTVNRDWAYARAWLWRELKTGD